MQFHLVCPLAFGALGLLPLSARAASECPVAGTLSPWGVNSTGYFPGVRRFAGRLRNLSSQSIPRLFEFDI
jgi:hypothetical protein